MGLYADRVLPRLVDVVCGGAAIHPLRARACTPLRGRVVELGFGSGLNVGHYPPSVQSVAAVEPSDLAWSLARRRLVAATVPVERAGLDGQRLPFADASFDSALTTWTLCTIPDVTRALAEVRRVLRPGGSLAFLEHGLAPDASVRRWQRRLEPAQKRLAGGCHLTRPVLDLVEASGFTVSRIEVFYLDGAPKAMGATSLGVARVAGG